MSLEVEIEKKWEDFTLCARFAASNTATAILGASGCGKSMTLRCIAGIVRPDRGRIVLDGRVLFDSEQGINLPPQQRGVGLLFQNYALFPGMTVEQNILCGLKHEKDPVLRRARCTEMLRAMRLEDVARHRPAALSGGQQQRTALARILVSQPRILMLDEPFTGAAGRRHQGGLCRPSERNSGPADGLQKHPVLHPGGRTHRPSDRLADRSASGPAGAGRLYRCGGAGP